MPVHLGRVHHIWRHQRGVHQEELRAERRAQGVGGAQLHTVGV